MTIVVISDNRWSLGRCFFISHYLTCSQNLILCIILLYKSRQSHNYVSLISFVDQISLIGLWHEDKFSPVSCKKNKMIGNKFSCGSKKSYNAVSNANIVLEKLFCEIRWNNFSDINGLYKIIHIL